MEEYREVLKQMKFNGYEKYDFLYFPKMSWNSSTNSIKLLTQHFIQKGHRVFLFDVSDENSIEDISNNLIIVNIKYDNLSYIDEIIKQYVIKDSVIFVEDPTWFELIEYLRLKYNLKIIFNCLNELLQHKNHEAMAKISEVCITYSLNSLDKVKENNNKAIMINYEELVEYIEGIAELIHELVSIIIVTFNNLEHTKNCINSILEKTAYPSFEIIIVDNKSQDNTPEYLLELQKQYKNIKVIFNDENYGFAKANNIGIRNSKGKYVILLNNDTIVTYGWISALIKHLDRDENLGQVGPVTNKIASASQIRVPYSHIDDMDYFAQKYTTDNLNKLYTDIEMIAMFCVAMRRNVINELGQLDESFGIGLIEDDDYSNRVIEKGYKIACAEDVFIHHYGSASFGKIDPIEYEKIYEKNKKIYESKWNKPLIYHKMRKYI